MRLTAFKCAIVCVVVIVASTNVTAYNQHPNAYSSPQYAKKLYPNQNPNYVGNQIPNDLQRNEVKNNNQYDNSNQYYNGPNQYSNANNNQYSNGNNNQYSNGFNQYNNGNPHNNDQLQRRNSVAPPSGYSNEDSWNSGGNGVASYNGSLIPRSTMLQAAASFLSGRGGQMLAEFARDMLARSSTGSSQVLSLNLTNLVILVVLKALILAAGFFGAGAWKGGHGYGRSIDDNKNTTYISESELLLYMSYLMGEQKGDYGCLNLVACQQHDQASLYTNGADLLLQAAKSMKGFVPYNARYERVAGEARAAAAWGEAGMPCAQRYRCAA